ncbi:alpha/beta fold hydrolase [Arthrobacter sp. ISL-72]|uniref:alpha/beta fold hydrolase n=1 Tax=Arthrobacter sp. ISL-72 TaxID=2819114 RepID=UPI001BE887F3|nr:alpha/beta fold hydrolase [Arthrobacter sp. ISL-72]MBT2597031.1 alpha/beta fold hydrolase [Arthrobacter sp. ISL-72]
MKDAAATDVGTGDFRGRMYASRAGSMDGPATSSPPVPSRPPVTVVLIHGIGVSHRYLSRLHHQLAAIVDTVSIDLPGFGSTPHPDRQLTVADQASFIHKVLDEAGVGQRVLVGHSMGAQFVLEAALQRPEMVPHLVLMGPVVDVRRRTVLRQALGLAKDALLYETPASNMVVFTDYARCWPGWYLKQLKVMMNYPTEDRIRDWRGPVLVLRGASDPIASGEWCRILVGRAPDGQLVEIPGCGHVAQYTGATQVSDAIVRFAGLEASTNAGKLPGV